MEYVEQVLDIRRGFLSLVQFKNRLNQDDFMLSSGFLQDISRSCPARLFLASLDETIKEKSGMIADDFSKRNVLLLNQPSPEQCVKIDPRSFVFDILICDFSV